MSPSSSQRHRRAGRKLAVSAAAVFVTLVPTACDYAAASQPPRSSTGSTAVPTDRAGHGHGSGHGSSRTVVPVGNPRSVPATPTGTVPPSTVPPSATPAPTTTPPATSTPGTSAPAPTSSVAPPPPPPANNGLVVLGRDCSGSALEPHNGFQLGPRCVDTAFGEVSAADRNPSLLITDAPTAVAVKQKFTISVSTRNLVRDRFLGAAAGGYYLESSFLNEKGLQRGHFHTACRMLERTDKAPDAAPVPAFFLATQDNGGGARPDTVVITVPDGLPTAGTAQCAVWAGDGSHRTPMMERANQTPAFDAVRIKVG